LSRFSLACSVAVILAGPLVPGVARAQSLLAGSSAIVAAAIGDQKAPKKKKDTGIQFRFDDHPQLRIGKKELGVDFRARFQFDTRRSDAPFDKHALDQLDIAKRRIGVEGDVYDAVHFEVMRELSDTKDPWRNVSIDYHQFKEAGFEYGKFKLPFGL